MATKKIRRARLFKTGTSPYPLLLLDRVKSECSKAIQSNDLGESKEDPLNNIEYTITITVNAYEVVNDNNTDDLPF